MLQAGAQYLNDQLKAFASQTVIYRRQTFSVPLQATLGSQLLKVTDRLGNTKVERTDRDFLFTAADLVLDGRLTEPQRGDTVDLTTGTVTERFEVTAPGKEPAWRYSDASKIRLRVHTKFKGIVS